MFGVTLGFQGLLKAEFGVVETAHQTGAAVLNTFLTAFSSQAPYATVHGRCPTMCFFLLCPSSLLAQVLPPRTRVISLLLVHHGRCFGTWHGLVQKCIYSFQDQPRAPSYPAVGDINPALP